MSYKGYFKPKNPKKYKGDPTNIIYRSLWEKKLDNTIMVVEIKPNKQTKPPKPTKKITKSYLNEVKTWGINSAKWKAAKSFCRDRNWNFVIMDEFNLGIANG